MVNLVRVSCSGFGIISPQRNAYLVHYNSDSSKRWFQFLGGAYHFERRVKRLLRPFVAKYEYDRKHKEDKRDIRLKIKEGGLEEFVSWYSSGRGRETTPYREIFDELVYEEKLLPADLCRFELHFISPKQYKAMKKDLQCHYYWDYFTVSFLLPEAEPTLLKNVQGHPTSRLVTADEIEEGQTRDGEKIAESVKIGLDLFRDSRKHP